jgi:ketosteroid isomerase-like protein
VRVPSDSLELVRRIYREWRPPGDPPLELLSEDVQWVNPPEAVEPGTRHGHAGVAEAMRNLGDAYPEAWIEVEELVDAGEGLVVSVVAFHTRGRGSGLEGVARQGYNWTVRDGKAVRFAWYPTPEQAFEAAGLRRD